MKRHSILISVSIAALLLAAVGGAGAQQTDTPVDYYDNESSNADTGSWLAGLTDASLDDIVTLGMRLGTFIIGGGVAAQGGVGSAGALLTGLVVAGVLGSVGVRSGAGTSGGLAIALMSAFLFLSVGIGATWAYPVVLFIVGLLIAAVFLRILR